MSDKFPMTPLGNERLKAQLKQLIEVDRPANARAIEVARGHGDLSENADYSAAKEEQAMIEARIQQLNAKIALAEVIDPTTLSGEKVMFGATVTIEDEDGEEKTYTIVGDDEADLKLGRISISSPVARGLIGRSVGDTAILQTPKGRKEVEVVDVKWLAVE
jgi:transcription elongation factor GreA